MLVFPCECACACVRACGHVCLSAQQETVHKLEDQGAKEGAVSCDIHEQAHPCQVECQQWHAPHRAAAHRPTAEPVGRVSAWERKRGPKMKLALLPRAHPLPPLLTVCRIRLGRATTPMWLAAFHARRRPGRPGRSMDGSPKRAPSTGLASHPSAHELLARGRCPCTLDNLTRTWVRSQACA